MSKKHKKESGKMYAAAASHALSFNLCNGPLGAAELNKDYSRYSFGNTKRPTR